MHSKGTHGPAARPPFALAVGLALAGALLGAGGASAADPADTGKWTIEPFPARSPYPECPASPNLLTNSVELVAVDESAIPDAGDLRTAVRLGGRFGLFALRRSGTDEDHPFHLSIDAGLSAQFDNEANQDSIGWDGFFGLTLSGATGPALAWRLGVLHTSAHVGDEYLLSSPRGRLGYSREEALAGVSLRAGGRARVDVEAGHGFGLRQDVQAPWRARIGLSLENRERVAAGHYSWYAAADLSGWEERDWRLDWAMQAGILFPGADRDWRIGISVHDGRPALSEFFQSTETAVSAGVWVDLR